MRSKKPTIRPRVVVVFKTRVARSGFLARKRTSHTKHNCLAVTPFHGFA